MPITFLQKRTFLASAPPFLTIPPSADEIGQIVVAANTAQRGIYIGLADAMVLDVPTNPVWHRIDAAAASVNVAVNIPLGTGATVEDDINEYDFSLAPVAMPRDSTATSEGLIESGYNIYLVCARDGATYLYGGPVPSTLGNENTPWDGSAVGAPAPTDAAHSTIQTADLIPFGGNPDAMVQTPTAGTSQTITSAAVGDTPLALIPFAGQTADLLVVDKASFDFDGYLTIVQTLIGDGPMITLEQEMGAGPMITAHSTAVPGTPLVTLQIETDNRGDLVDRAILAGDVTDKMVVENAILDGGVLV